MVSFTLSHKAYGSLLNRVLYVPCAPAWSTCQRTNIPNACHLLIFTCQRANKRAKGVPIFQTFLLWNAKGNFYTLLLYKTFCIIFDTIVIHILCICIIHKNCIILHFYTLWKKRVGNFCFLKLFCSLVKNENTKRPGFYTLLVTRVFLNFPQLKQLNKMKNMCKYCDLLELWSAWIGQLR